MRGHKRNVGMLVLCVLAGALIGSLLWHLAAPILPQSIQNGLLIGSTAAPWTLDLGFLRLSLGVVMDFNVGSVIGLAGGILVWWMA